MTAFADMVVALEGATMMRSQQESVAAVCSIASLLTVAPGSAAERVTLMAYNVEKFFDADNLRMPNAATARSSTRKGSLFADDLREQESAKIACGEAHFRALATGRNPALYIKATKVDDIF